MMDVLSFVCLTKEIEFIFDIQGDTPKVLCSLSERKVTAQEDNQGAIAIAVMRPHTKHITINYHNFRSFVANGDIEIQHIDTK